MMPKRIVRWDTELINNDIPISFNERTYIQFDVPFTISHRYKSIESIFVTVTPSCYVFKGDYPNNPKLNISKIKLFELTTLSKFSFTNPWHEESSFEFIYNCIIAAISDFNERLLNHSSDIVKRLDGSGNNFQHPIPSFAALIPEIISVWRLGLQSS